MSKQLEIDFSGGILIPTDPYDCNGTCLQGYLYKYTYKELVERFGEPMEGDRSKVDAEWVLKSGDNKIVTIYNWKNGRNYLGDRGLDVEDMDFWHIGGSTPEVLIIAKAAFGDQYVHENYPVPYNT